MRTERLPLAIAIVLGFSFWIIDAAIDSLFFHDESFLKSLLFDPGAIELYMRSVAFGMFLIFGVIISKTVAKQISIRKEAERSKKRFMVLLEQASDAIVLTNLEGRLLYVNFRAVKLCGYSRDELLNKHFSELHPQKELERVSEAFRNTTKEGVGALDDTAILRKDGTIVAVDITGSLIEFEGEKLIQASFRDITAHKLLEDTIRNIAEGVSAETGEKFFSSMVCHLSRILGVEYSFLGELKVEEPEQVEVLAICAHGDLIDNFTYNIAHSPSENVVGGDLCCYPREVQKQFPKDHMLKNMNAECYAGIPLFSSKGLPLGILTVLGCQPLRNTQIVKYALKVFATRAAAELERKRSEDALKQSESNLRALSHQILTAQENERERLAADLHDVIGQTLGSIKIRLDTLLKKAMMHEGKVEAEALRDLIPVVRGAMEEVRAMGSDLRPSTLDSLGLISTINWFCREFNATYTDISVEVRAEIEEDKIPASLKVQIFRILQEALNNVAKHSKADSVQVYLGLKDELIVLNIEDNGSGMDLEHTMTSEDGSRGFGIPSMKQRTEYSGGAFSLESIYGEGTSVQASWPISA